jgi:hypothetical protein
MGPALPSLSTTSMLGNSLFRTILLFVALNSVLVHGQEKPLSIYHPQCTSVGQSRTPECMAAMHRYCSINHLGDAAYPQEVGTDEIGFLCMPATSYANVAYSEIPGCAGNPANTQSTGCYHSAHSYCQRFPEGGTGIIQELGPGVAGLACVATPWYSVVKIAELAALHGGCTSSSLAQSPPCVAAAHRYCTSNGLGAGGVINELGRDEVALACIVDAAYTSAKMH